LANGREVFYLRVFNAGLEIPWKPASNISQERKNYRRASSVRFVLREPELEAGATASFAIALFLWQELAHQRFSYCGNSHIFVHFFPPFICSQWQ